MYSRCQIKNFSKKYTLEPTWGWRANSIVAHSKDLEKINHPSWLKGRRADSKEGEPTRAECSSEIGHAESTLMEKSRLVQSQDLLDRTSEPTRRRESRLEQSKKGCIVHPSQLEEEGANSKHQASRLEGVQANSNIANGQKRLVF